LHNSHIDEGRVLWGRPHGATVIYLLAKFKQQRCPFRLIFEKAEAAGGASFAPFAAIWRWAETKSTARAFTGKDVIRAGKVLLSENLSRCTVPPRYRLMVWGSR
jgi:hypothetical protein